MSNEINITPIQKAIEDLKNLQKMTLESQVVQIKLLESLLPYEEQFAKKWYLEGGASRCAIQESEYTPDFKTLYKKYTDGKQNSFNPIS